MKKNELGRSMVEMLGVLAIIGILSVAGVGGYSLAMNRYRANQIFDIASRIKSSTTGGGISSATDKYGQTILKADMHGVVCITWGADLSQDVKDLFREQVARYKKVRESASELCINMNKRVG